MNSIDSLNSSLYFSALAKSSSETQKNQKQEKTQKTKKTSFSSMVEKSKEQELLANEGFPIEIAGLSVEESVIYLKDAVDSWADKLSEFTSQENFASFRKSVSQFLRYIQKNNYEISKTKRFGKRKTKGVFFEETRPRDPYFQIHIVDTKLDELAAMVMQNHADKLKLLSKVDEIKGLLVDFLAV